MFFSKKKIGQEIAGGGERTFKGHTVQIIDHTKFRIFKVALQIQCQKEI